MVGPELVRRLDRVEAELEALQAEVADVRRLAAGAAASRGPVEAAAPLTAAETMRLAWAAFERGRHTKAVEHLSAALELALKEGDERVLGDASSFIGVAVTAVETPLRARLHELAERTAAASAPKRSALPFPKPAPHPEPPRGV